MTVDVEEELVELEIRLSASERSQSYDNREHFLEVTFETFLTEPRIILPSELYYLQPVSDTLTLSTTVIQAEPHG